MTNIPSEILLLTRLCLSSSEALTKLATLTCSFASLFISSCACCLLKATCAAMTFCLSDIKMHLLHRQLRHWHALLCPFNQETTPWFLHLAHFGALGGFVSGESNDGGESGKCMKLGPSIFCKLNGTNPPCKRLNRRECLVYDKNIFFWNRVITLS